MFEDDPIEFIRRDLEGSDSDSRRRSATDFLRELATKLEAKVTEVAMKYVNGFLSQFNNNRGNWKAKDTAIYLFSSIAVKGNVTSVGVSSTNLLVDVISFFQQNVLPDLLGDVKPSSPILTVDAIKYIHTFRNQLTKEQLLEAFKLLSMHLHSSEYVVYTYAAITIERVLSIRGNDGLMVSRVDIADVVGPLLSALFSLILKNRSTPEKLAENEFLMKCVMRVLITTQDSIKGDTARGVLVKLLEIVGEIAKNPSNPRFTHYTFESIGAVIRFSYTAEFDTLIIEPFLGILGNDVTEFIPYALQILAQLLQAKPSSQGLPQQYEMLVQPLMAPVLWEAKGNVPALVMLLEAILAHGGGHLFEGPGKLTPLLGVFQKLIATRSHDAFGFDLLEHIFAFVSLDAVRPYLRDIAALLLRRLQDSRTDKYVARLSKFEYFLSAIETRPDLGPVFAVDLIDSAQEGIFGQVLTQFMLPATLQLVNSKDRKLAIIGLCRILCENPKFTSGSYSAKFGDGLRTLVQLLQGTTVDSRADEDLLSGDMEFDSLTFGSSFSKLQTAAFQRYDPIPNVSNAKDVFASSIRKLAASHPDAIRQVVSTLPPDQQTELKNLGLA
jgi:exportin-2 (importin alpha re-exporter)